MCQDEANLKADFPSMGNLPDIPRAFKTNGRVRNKNVTKRQTEMQIKEIWKVRMAHRKAGKTGVDLPEMIFLHLQKTKGLHQAVIEVTVILKSQHAKRASAVQIPCCRTQHIQLLSMQAVTPFCFDLPFCFPPLCTIGFSPDLPCLQADAQTYQRPWQLTSSC